MLKFFISILFSCSLAIADEQLNNVLKEKVENVKVGFVNIRKLITNAPQVEMIRHSLAKEFENENQKIINLRISLSKLNTDYKKQSSDDILAKLQATINQKQLELIKYQQSLNDSYSLRRNEKLGELQTLIVETVASVSKEKSLDIVLNNTGVIYINGRVDITQDVFKRLAEKAKDMK